jgi:hypothetical protein
MASGVALGPGAIPRFHVPRKEGSGGRRGDPHQRWPSPRPGSRRSAVNVPVPVPVPVAERVCRSCRSYLSGIDRLLDAPALVTECGCVDWGACRSSRHDWSRLGAPPVPALFVRLGALPVSALFVRLGAPPVPALFVPPGRSARFGAVRPPGRTARSGAVGAASGKGGFSHQYKLITATTLRDIS